MADSTNFATSSVIAIAAVFCSSWRELDAAASKAFGLGTAASYCSFSVQCIASSFIFVGTTGCGGSWPRC